jgi:hypothetical protein
MIVEVVGKAFRFEYVEVTFKRLYVPDTFMLTLSREEARRYEMGEKYEMTFKEAK